MPPQHLRQHQLQFFSLPGPMGRRPQCLHLSTSSMDYRLLLILPLITLHAISITCQTDPTPSDISPSTSTSPLTPFSPRRSKQLAKPSAPAPPYSVSLYGESKSDVNRLETDSDEKNTFFAGSWPPEPFGHATGRRSGGHADDCHDELGGGCCHSGHDDIRCGNDEVGVEKREAAQESQKKRNDRTIFHRKSMADGPSPSKSSTESPSSSSLPPSFTPTPVDFLVSSLDDSQFPLFSLSTLSRLFFCFTTALLYVGCLYTRGKEDRDDSYVIYRRSFVNLAFCLFVFVLFYLSLFLLSAFVVDPNVLIKQLATAQRKTDDPNSHHDGVYQYGPRYYQDRRNNSTQQQPLHHDSENVDGFNNTNFFKTPPPLSYLSLNKGVHMGYNNIFETTLTYSGSRTSDSARFKNGSGGKMGSGGRDDRLHFHGNDDGDISDFDTEPGGGGIDSDHSDGEVSIFFLSLFTIFFEGPPQLFYPFLIADGYSPSLYRPLNEVRPSTSSTVDPPFSFSRSPTIFLTLESTSSPPLPSSSSLASSSWWSSFEPRLKISAILLMRASGLTPIANMPSVTSPSCHSNSSPRTPPSSNSDSSPFLSSQSSNKVSFCGEKLDRQRASGNLFPKCQSGGGSGRNIQNDERYSDNTMCFDSSEYAEGHGYLGNNETGTACGGGEGILSDGTNSHNLSNDDDTDPTVHGRDAAKIGHSRNADHLGPFRKAEALCYSEDSEVSLHCYDTNPLRHRHDPHQLCHFNCADQSKLFPHEDRKSGQFDDAGQSNESSTYMLRCDYIFETLVAREKSKNVMQGRYQSEGFSGRGHFTVNDNDGDSIEDDYAMSDDYQLHRSKLSSTLKLRCHGVSNLLPQLNSDFITTPQSSYSPLAEASPSSALSLSSTPQILSAPSPHPTSTIPCLNSDAVPLGEWNEERLVQMVTHNISSIMRKIDFFFSSLFSRHRISSEISTFFQFLFFHIFAAIISILLIFLLYFGLFVDNLLRWLLFPSKFNRRPCLKTDKFGSLASSLSPDSDVAKNSCRGVSDGRVAGGFGAHKRDDSREDNVSDHEENSYHCAKAGHEAVDLRKKFSYCANRKNEAGVYNYGFCCCQGIPHWEKGRATMDKLIVWCRKLIEVILSHECSSCLRNYVFAPLNEELLFRSIHISFHILFAPPSSLSLWNIIAYNQLVFSLAHIHHHIYAWMYDDCPALVSVCSALFQCLYTSIFSALSCSLFLKTGSLAAPIAAHSLCNFLQIPSFDLIHSSSRYTTKTLRIASAMAHLLGIYYFFLLLDPLTSPFAPLSVAR